MPTELNNQSLCESVWSINGAGMALQEDQVKTKEQYVLLCVGHILTRNSKLNWEMDFGSG